MLVGKDHVGGKGSCWWETGFDRNGVFKTKLDVHSSHPPERRYFAATFREREHRTKRSVFEGHCDKYPEQNQALVSIETDTLDKAKHLFAPEKTRSNKMISDADEKPKKNKQT